MTKIRDRWGFFHTKAIFNYLKPFAARCETVAYSVVAHEFGTSERALGGRELKAIWDECDDRRWPHLNALVVTMRDGLPGIGYTPNDHPVDEDEFELIMQCICNFDWTDKHL